MFLNLYAANTATVKTPAGDVGLREATRYPWDGAVAVTVDVPKPRAFAVNLRVPAWLGAAIPGGLYTFQNPPPAPVKVTVNGRSVPLEINRGFATVSRTWKRGDIVRIDLPMAPRRIASDARIADNAGKVAVQRGPIVYALEGIDNGGKVLAASLTNAPLTHEFRPALLGGVEVVKGTGAQGPLTFVPYYAWNNRGVGEMAVWISAARASASQPAPPSGGGAQAKLMALTFAEGTPNAWDPDVVGSPIGVSAVAAGGGGAQAGGAFSKVHGVNQQGFARFR